MLYGLLVAGVPLAPVETFFHADYSLDIFLFNLFLYNTVGVLTSYASRRFRVVLTRSLDSEAQGKAMRELDAQKTSFFSNISHELRTPLTLILTPWSRCLPTTWTGCPTSTGTRWTSSISTRSACSS